MNRATGYTMVEVIVFILILGLIAVGVLSTFNTVLTRSNNPVTVLQATQLANARMMIILQQRRINGVSTLVDPCVSSPPAACTNLATYATARGFTVTSNIVTAGTAKTATITITQSGNTLTSVQLRFVE